MNRSNSYLPLFHLMALLLILISVPLCYTSSLHGEFQFDDDMTIVQNPDINNLRAYAPINMVKEAFSFKRPLVGFTFAVNYALGGLSVTGYHAFNIFLHMITVALIFLFTRKTLILSGTDRAEILALIITGIFALHPVQSQAVSYLSQRSEVMASLFYIISLGLFVLSIERGMRVTGVLFYLGGCTALLLGFASKEIIITLPVMVVVYSFFFLGKHPVMRRMAVFLPLLAAGVVAFLVIIINLKNSPDAGFSIKGIKAWEYFLTQCRVVMTYLRILVLPVNQNLDYDYPISRGFFEPQTLAAFVTLVLLIFAAFLVRRSLRVASFGIFWFFLVLSPTSSFVPVADVINEHRLYLASWGIITAIVVAGNAVYLKISSNKSFRVDSALAAKFAVSLAVCIILALGVALYERNKVWQSKMSLWQDVVVKSPNKARANNNMGNCHFIRGDFTAAIPYYRKALAIDPNWYESQYNLAVSLDKTGYNSEAVYYFLTFAREAPAVYEPLKLSILKTYGLKK